MNKTVRRLASPVVPVLRPIRRQTQIWLGTSTTEWQRPSLRAWSTRRRVKGVRGISRGEFAALQAQFPYYRPRGRYVSAASRLIDELSAKYGVTRALELGAHRRPVATGADVMDIAVPKDISGAGEVYVADATQPWPFADKSYDLFVALQVFEHLGTSQPQVFREVVRVARHAVISLPVDWVMPDPANCHHGITQERILGWFAPIAPTRIVVGNGGPKPRIIYVFENLPERLDPPTA